MDARSTAEVMTEYGLFPSKVSQELLLGVAEGKWGSVEPDLDRALWALRGRYEEILTGLPACLARPRNLPFYMIVREKYPQFGWQFFEGQNGETKVRFENVPKVANVNPSLLSLLLERVPANALQGGAFALQTSGLPRPLVDAVRDSFEAIDVSRPAAHELKEIVSWLRAGLAGEPLTIFTPVCPDYAYEETGDPTLPYRYTFDGLGSGVGIVAARALKAAPVLVSNLRRCGLDVRCVVGSGDFEAFSPENLARLQVTEDEFIARLRASQRAFRDACPVDVELPLITDLCGGKRRWLEYLLEAKSLLEAGDYGASDLSDRAMARILAARKRLYQAWYGFDGSRNAYLGVLIAQGAEYAAMGRIVAERFGRPLVLGADHPAMQPFYSIYRRLPVLYLRRVY